MEISPACLKCGCAMKIISLMQIPSSPNCHGNQLFPAQLLPLSFTRDLSWGCAWLQGEETREILEALRKVSRGRASLGEQRRSPALSSAWGRDRPSFLKRLWPGKLLPARAEEGATKSRREKKLPEKKSWEAARAEHPPGQSAVPYPYWVLPPEVGADTEARTSKPYPDGIHHLPKRPYPTGMPQTATFPGPSRGQGSVVPIPGQSSSCSQLTPCKKEPEESRTLTWELGSDERLNSVCGRGRLGQSL